MTLKKPDDFNVDSTDVQSEEPAIAFQELLYTAKTAHSTCSSYSARISAVPPPREEVEKDDCRLGQLMIDLEILSPEYLDFALRLTQEFGLPLGRVIIMAGWISERQLTSVVQLQSLLKDRLLTREKALEAMRVVSQSDVGLEEALSQVGWQGNADLAANRLGQLLLAAGFINPQDLERSLNRSFSTGLPFGRLLVMSGALTESMLAAALSAQVLLRDGKITYEQAVEALVAARAREISVEIPLVDKGFYRLPAQRTIRLGELLVLAGLLTESDLMYVVEMGLVNQKPVGQVLMDFGLVTERLLNTALKLQAMVANGTIKPVEAARALTKVHHYGLSVAQAIQQGSSITKSERRDAPSIDEFLRLVGTINSSDVQRSIEIGLKNCQIMSRILLVAGAVDEATLNAALRCISLVRDEVMSMEQAIIAFDCSQRGGSNVDEVLRELGWARESAQHNSSNLAHQAPGQSESRLGTSVQAPL